MQSEKTVLQIEFEKDGLLSFVPYMVLHNYTCSLLLQICYLDIHFVLAFHIAFDTYMKSKWKDQYNMKRLMKIERRRFITITANKSLSSHGIDKKKNVAYPKIVLMMLGFFRTQSIFDLCFVI